MRTRFLNVDLELVADTDLASPTGMLFGASLTAFGPRERAALFGADWAYGRILAVACDGRSPSPSRARSGSWNVSRMRAGWRDGPPMAAGSRSR